MNRFLILMGMGVALSCGATVDAVALSRSSAMPLGRSTAAPTGYVVFCAQRPAECQRLEYADTVSDEGSIANYWSAVFHPSVTPQYLRRMPAADFGLVSLTASSKATLVKTNRQINRLIRARPDDDASQANDTWSLPLEEGRREGDCEDYVLEKRRALVRAGFPSAALSIAVVDTVAGSRHAVLIVGTDQGELVLDSRSPWILPWEDVSYAWIKRQSPGDPNRWVELSGLSGHKVRAQFRR